MRLIIVSNRLPVTVHHENDKMLLRESVGGLATGLKAFIESTGAPLSNSIDCVWFGWPGTTIEKCDREELSHELYKKKYYPVFLEDEDVKEFYSGFCNKTLWPLFHYFPTKAIYDGHYWEQYKKVNELFLNELIPHIQEGDIVWVNDYHLLLLCGLIRKKFPTIAIGFFLHIPFPSHEIFRLLPQAWRNELLTGMLGADTIGFHTHSYGQDFLKCALYSLGVEHTRGEMVFQNRVVKVDCFPMGVDFTKIQEESIKVSDERKQLLQKFNGKKLIISIDRLDYTKGILNRLEAFNDFLKKYPQYHRNVVLMLIVVPSRIVVGQYKKIKRKIDKLVGRINGDYSDVSWLPILYHYREFTFKELVAIYSAADVALVTPLRDGMNLIAKEYLASRTDKTGVLVLSEMAGASQELFEAEIVNPNSIDELSEALHRSLNLSKEEQIIRNVKMQTRLQQYDVCKWADDFLRNVKHIHHLNNVLNIKILSRQFSTVIQRDFNKAEKKMILSDYDGTLVPFFKFPELARPNKDLISLLSNISMLPNTELFIVTGRDRVFIDKWFSELPINFIAEHGAWIRYNNHWKKDTGLSGNWKKFVLPFLNDFCLRLPGSFIEEKEFSLVWHFRNANQELSAIRVLELGIALQDVIGEEDLEIAKRVKSIEICNRGISKAKAVKQLINSGKYDFITSFGDDNTDEEVFEVLPAHAYTVKVGLGETNARFNVPSNVEIIALLNGLYVNEFSFQE